MKKTILFILLILSACTIKAQTKTTAILGAFGDEAKLIHSQIKTPKEVVIQGIHFTTGILNGHKVVLALTGMGKVNAAITTSLVLDHFQPAQVIFTGIAGGVNSNISPGDLVIGEKIAYHDYGTITPDSLYRRPTQEPVKGVSNPLYFPSTPALVNLAQKVSGKLAFQNIGGHPPKIVTGIIVTGDVFVSSTLATQQLWEKMHAEATEMEGAAVAQTCWQQKVPFLVIRSLSDSAGNNAHQDVQAFYQTAAHNSATLVMAIVGQIK